MSADSHAEEPTDEAVVEAAASAARGLILDRYKQSAVRDLDVTVTFEDGVLDVDVYLNVPEDVGPPAEEIVEEAAMAARDAADDLFADAED